MFNKRLKNFIISFVVLGLLEVLLSLFFGKTPSSHEAMIMMSFASAWMFECKGE